MQFGKIRNIKFKQLILPILVVLLIVSLVFFVIDSLKMVSETNKNNFAYMVTIRNLVEEIDKTIERSEVNTNVFSNVISSKYNTHKINDEEYNIRYVSEVGNLTKALLENTPDVDGVWFQIDSNLPFSNQTYSWYKYQDGKIVDLNEQFNEANLSSRKINPEEDPYYFDAVKAGEMIWTGVYKDADTNTEMLTIAEPVYKNHLLIGVVGMDITVEDLKYALKTMQNMFKGSEIFLLDNDGNIILEQLEPNAISKNGNTSFIKLLTKQKQSEEKMMEYIDNGVRKTAVLIPLSSENMNILVTFPNKLMFKGFDRLFQLVSFILLILIVLVGISFFSTFKLKKANKKFENEISRIRNMIRYSPTMIAVKDKDGIYSDCNDKFAELIGFTREEVIGQTDYALFDKVTADSVAEKDYEVKKTKQYAIDEYWHTCANGKKKLLEKYRLPLFDEKGEAIGILINFIDITKRHQIQEHLEKAKEAAEKATMMKSNFLANMSHEIRTPMNGVLGFLQLLEDTNPTAEQREFIMDAQKSSELLLNIINEVLDFSKIEAGKLITDTLSFDVRSIVEDITIMNTSNACKKGIDVSSLICSDVPKKVLGDPTRVKQILNNLVNNAIKFTQEGDVVIYVNQVVEDDDTCVLSFRVKDSGIGISEEKIKLIFDSFTQADASTTRKYGGTGLGLAISQKLAGLMNGHISVESTESEGSTFTLTLSFKKDKAVKSKINHPIKSLNGINILVVSDNKTDLKIIRYYLNEENCGVQEAHSQEEAIDVINQCNREIAAILIDYKIQNAGEVELSLLLRLNKSSNDIPLILYTSLAKRGDAVEAREKGFVGYLTKPLKKRELHDAIKFVVYGQNESSQEGFITKHFIKENKFDVKTKILMVEDTELNCKFILKLLNRAGLTCDIANEGNQAVEVLKTKKYDLILMDCQMPIMDGFEATREIRKLEGDSSHTPIIAMTANAMKADQERCFEAGMDDYISKPIGAGQLFSIMSKYIKLENEADINDKDCYLDTIIEKMTLEFGFTKNEAVELVNDFMKFLSQVIVDFEGMLEKNEFDNLNHAAHKLKGASANLRIEEIAKLCFKLEKACKSKDETACSLVLAEIKKYFEYLNTLSVK